MRHERGRRAILFGFIGAATLAGLTAAAQDGPGAADEGWRLELARPAPIDEGFPERLDRLERLACSACHQTIAEEWSQTLHGLAWIDPRYQKALKGKRRKESCYGCHIPAPLHLRPPETFNRKPRPRENATQDRHFAISCQSCHLGPDSTILGPWGAETDAHRSQQHEHFVEAGSNALCLTCHRTTIGPVIGIAKDFEAARLGERGMSCVGCHMAPVYRPAATDEDGQALAPRKARSHLLQTPRDPQFLAQAFALGARAEGDSIVLRVDNRAGHRVPGLQDRRIVFQAEVRDAAGKKVAGGETQIDDRVYLRVEGNVEWRFEGEADEVHVTGLHYPPGKKKPHTFLETTLPVVR